MNNHRKIIECSIEGRFSAIDCRILELNEWQRPCGVALGCRSLNSRGIKMLRRAAVSSDCGMWHVSPHFHCFFVVASSNSYHSKDDGYLGGKDDRAVNWAEEAPGEARPFNQATSDMSVPYNGPSMMVMKFHVNPASKDYKRNWPRYIFQNLLIFENMLP